MKSIADSLRRDTRIADAKRSAADRVSLALRLGDIDVRTFANARGIHLDEARRLLARQRQYGRHPSRCHDSLLT